MRSQFLQLNIFYYSINRVKKVNKDIRIIKEVLELLASLRTYSLHRNYFMEYNLTDIVLINRY